MSETLALRLDDYAVALDETGDHAGAVAVRERVYAWRTSHRGRVAYSTPLPYGRNCPGSESSARQQQQKETQGQGHDREEIEVGHDPDRKAPPFRPLWIGSL